MYSMATIPVAVGHTLPQQVPGSIPGRFGNHEMPLLPVLMCKCDSTFYKPRSILFAIKDAIM